jgi:predicted secreted protein
MVGVPGVRVLDLAIVGSGEDTMYMSYARPWEFKGFESNDMTGVIQIHMLSEEETHSQG